MTSRRIAGVVLAAGASQRMGRPKQLLRWRGQSLIAHSAQAALGAGLNPVVVVVGSHAGEAAAELQTLAVTIVENPAWPEGMSTSMRAGLSALPADADAAILLPVDQPRLTSQHLWAMSAAYQASGKPIVVSTFHGQRSSPTLFDRTLFGQLLRVTGDVGGRPVVDANPDLVETVEAADERTLFDVDTDEDWQRMTN